MNATHKPLVLGLVTVRGTARMAFRRDGKVFYYPSITKKAVEAGVEIASTWED